MTVRVGPSSNGRQWPPTRETTWELGASIRWRDAVVGVVGGVRPGAGRRAGRDAARADGGGTPVACRAAVPGGACARRVRVAAFTGGAAGRSTHHGEDRRAPSRDDGEPAPLRWWGGRGAVRLLAH